MSQIRSFLLAGISRASSWKKQRPHADKNAGFSIITAGGKSQAPSAGADATHRQNLGTGHDSAPGEESPAGLSESLRLLRRLLGWVLGVLRREDCNYHRVTIHSELAQTIPERFLKVNF
jgi:hypothetical protein